MSGYEIMICPLKKLYRLSAEGDMENVAVLAVSSGEIEKQRLAGFCRALCMGFADILDPSGPNAFSPAAAAEIADFVRSLPQTLDTLLICCDSGESRSTAMAAAVNCFLGRDDTPIWEDPHYHPNLLVYSLLRQALGIPIPAAVLREKQRRSRKALADAINGRR